MGSSWAMLEEWLAGILRERLGKFLEISPKQLRMGVWSGELSLVRAPPRFSGVPVQLAHHLARLARVQRNIRLKEVFLPDWPFHVKGGHMGRLTIQIPWQALSRKSAVVTMVRRNAQCRLSA